MKTILFLLLSCIWYSSASTEECIEEHVYSDGRVQTTYSDGLELTRYSKNDHRLQSIWFPDGKMLWEYKDGSVRILSRNE